jgi:hypothetical protein
VKPKVAPEDREEGTVRVQFQVQFSRGPKGRQRLREARTRAVDAAVPSEDAAPLPREAATGPLPRITRLLVLGHRIEAMLRSGEIPDLGAAARVIGITNARVTQITNLTLLAADIQEDILALPRGRGGRSVPTEREIRTLTGMTLWEDQQPAWAGFRARLRQHLHRRHERPHDRGKPRRPRPTRARSAPPSSS